MKKTGTRIVSLMIILFFLSGCASTMGSKEKKGTGWGAGIGAGLGAIVGQVTGGDTESTLIGAGVGTLLGGLLGNQVGVYMDEQELKLEEVARQSEMLSIQREQDALRATFRGKAMFAYNSAELLPGSYEEVRRVADILAEYEHTSVLIEGHTDVQGDAGYNQTLSEGRANSVKNVLIQGGVNPNRIQVIGYGETKPISDSHALNRRVELKLTPVMKK